MKNAEGFFLFHLFQNIQENNKNKQTGIAIDNTVSPKMLYIATDPSSPQGAQYVAALYSFYKPEIGTGRLTNNLPPNPPVICVGCTTIEVEAQANQDKFDHAYHVRIATEIIGSLLASLALLAFIVVAIVFILVGVREVVNRNFKKKSSENDSIKEDAKTPFSLDDDEEGSDFMIEDSAISPVDDVNNNQQAPAKRGFFDRLFGKKDNHSTEYLMVSLNQDSV